MSRRRTPPARRSIGSWVAVIAIGLAIAAAAYTHVQLGNLRKESARRLGELEQATLRANETANRADAEARAARERTALLEARLAEEQGQREALEQLYADLSRGRDEAVLVEVERLVAMAGQELSISGNVATALAALQTADVRLARTDSARFLPLRRMIARDIERLKVAPTVDIAGMAVKLDQIAAGVDSWPLLSDARAASAAVAPAPTRRRKPLPRRRERPGGNAGSNGCRPSSASIATWWCCGGSRRQSRCCCSHSSSNSCVCRSACGC